MPCRTSGGAARNRHVGIVIQPGLAKTGNGGLDGAVAIRNTFPTAGDSVLGGTGDATQKASEQAPTGRGFLSIRRVGRVVASRGAAICITLMAGSRRTLPPLSTPWDKVIHDGRGCTLGQASAIEKGATG